MDRPSANYELPNNPSEASARQNLIDDFAGSFGHALFQQPLDGLTQLARKVTGEDIATKQIVAPVEAAQFGTDRWHMQQLGSGLGAVVPFLAINKLTHAATGSGMVAAEMSLTTRAATAGFAGFVNDSILRPVAEDEQNFFGARIKNGLTSAVTFASLTGVEAGLNRTQARMMGLSSGRELALNSSLGRTMATHFAAGGLVGAGNAQAESIFSGTGFATTQDTIEHAYQFAFIGASMGGFGKLEQSLSNKIKPEVARGGDAPRTAEKTMQAGAREVLLPILERLKNDTGRVNKDTPESWLVAKDPIAYESARAVAVDRMSKIYDGEPQNLHELLQEATTKGRLTPEQAKAYEYFMGDIVHGFEQRGNSMPSEKSTQVGNLQHTLREARSLLQDPALANAKPEEVFKALVSSAMSDARKPAGLMAVANHAYVAAAEIHKPLSRALKQAYGERMSPAESQRLINECSNIVLEHHLQGPRDVLGGIIHLPLIRQGIAGDIAAKMSTGESPAPELQPLVEALKGRDPVTVTEAQKTALEKLGMKHITEEIAGLPTLLDKHLNAEKYPSSSHKNGPLELALTPAETRSLQRIGLSGLFLPNPKSTYYQASQITSAADQVQYVTAIERSIKYDGMFGPEFDIAKGRKAIKLGDGSANAEASYAVVRDRLSDIARERLDKMFNQTRENLPKMRSEFVSDWRRDKALVLDSEGRLPFYDADLKWVDVSAAKPLTATENRQLAEMTGTKGALSGEQQTQLTSILERKYYEQAVQLNSDWINHLVKLGETRGVK